MDRIPLYDLEPFGRVSVARRHAIDIAVLPVHEALVGAAESHRALEQVFEDRLQVEGRAADDLEHVGRRSLLLQRFGELRPASASSRLLTSSCCCTSPGDWRA